MDDQKKLPKIICERWNLLSLTPEPTEPVLMMKIQNLLEENFPELLNNLFAHSIKEDDIYKVLNLESETPIKAERICELVLKKPQ